VFPEGLIGGVTAPVKTKRNKHTIPSFESS
jgi:hypothetical protein